MYEYHSDVPGRGIKQKLKGFIQTYPSKLLPFFVFKIISHLFFNTDPRRRLEPNLSLSPLAVVHMGGSQKRGQCENTENVTLQKRPMTVIIPSFWRSHTLRWEIPGIPTSSRTDPIDVAASSSSHEMKWHYRSRRRRNVVVVGARLTWNKQS